MKNQERFKQNLEKWAPLNLDAAQKLATLECQEVFVCQNEDGQLNLKRTLEGSIQYFHSTHSPLREAQQWFLTLDLKNTLVLYIYGIGLGYYFDVVEEWLKEDPKRYVVFLEDNLEVIKCFLETERATEFLKNKQTKLFYFSWDTSYFSFGLITSFFSLAPFKISFLKFYEKSETTHVQEFYARIAFFHDSRLGTSAEFLALAPGGFIANYYKNLLELPRSKLELKMKGHFKDIPAIICGAGPSLAKNIHVLKNLQDKALIMAGGTAMNVLNGAGIIPHFGLGIDPNPAHYNRLISNTAFEEPFFYRQRMFYRALKVIHGERIYVTGAGGYRLPAWFEEKLGIPQVNPIEEGHNVVNFNLAIAKELGCNPILIVGVDLAYSDNLSYAPGIVRHAIHEPRDAFLTKYSHEELLVKDDVNGVPVHTLWKWVNESLWFSQFASRNPELTLLNCTEGGIGFTRVPNMKLADAAKKYLTKNFDFSSMVHGEIQNSALPENLTFEKILENFEVFARSLLHSESFCSTLMFELGKLFQETQTEEYVPQNEQPAIIKEYLDKLEAEDAYKFLLQDYKEKYLEIFFPRLHFIESDSTLYTEKEIRIKRLIFDICLYTFLAKVARHNINIISNILSGVVNDSTKPVAKPAKKTLSMKEELWNQIENAKKNDHYSFQNNRLQITDPELGLDYKKNCVCEEKSSFYPNGAVKSKVYRHGEKFHGPAFFYAENGQHLAENWYIDGLLEGKGWFYYPSGALYALKRYRKGLLNGRQEYYYQNGFPKSVIFYKDGLIDNEMILFHDNGRIKREMHFTNGKRNGLERMWNEDGMLMLEANYKNDAAIGTAREWHANGNLAKEITYSENSDELKVKQWQENGVPVGVMQEARGKDYFDLVTNHSTILNTSLQNIYQNLISIAPSIPEQKSDDKSTAIEQDLLVLKQEMDKLSKYSQEILVMGGYEGKNPKEALWKTPEVEKMIRAQLDGVSQQLADSANITQENLKDLFEKIGRMKTEDDPDNPNNPPS